MSYSINRVKWEEAAPKLKHIREQVFIYEQRIPKKIEFDDKDNSAYHMLICDGDDQKPIATGRILANGEISRIAVVMPFRKKKVDKLILKGLIEIATELALNEVYINIPLDYVEYYKKKQFITQGNVFMELGVPRQKMTYLIAS